MHLSQQLPTVSNFARWNDNGISDLIIDGCVHDPDGTDCANLQ